MENKLHEYCKFCGASDSPLYFEKDGFQLLKCSACSLVYLPLAADVKGLMDLYSANYFQSGADNRVY